jgi:very-short-patch-repair endonuclease
MPRRPLTPPINVARAHAMRLAPTWTEHLLWQAIRGKRLGVAFRRQVPIGRYIVDFLAPGARLVVEVDGGYHACRRTADARRDAWLQRQGYRVLRLDGERVRRDLNAAVEQVRQALGATG